MKNSAESTSAAEPAKVADRAAVGIPSAELNTSTVIGVTIRYIYVADIMIIPSIILNKKNKPFLTGRLPTVA